MIQLAVRSLWLVGFKIKTNHRLFLGTYLLMLLLSASRTLSAGYAYGLRFNLLLYKYK